MKRSGAGEQLFGLKVVDVSNVLDHNLDMLDRVAQVPLSKDEVEALRLLTAEQGVMIRDRTILLDLEAKGFVRPSTEGWVVTIAGHLRYLKVLADAL